MKQEKKGPAHWTDKTLRDVLQRFPESELYTCAAGISPSGVVHFGNFRDVMTSYMVYRALLSDGKKARMLFSWDDFDRYRKVPAGVDPAFEKYIGMPLCKIPDPSGKYESYARSFQIEFEESMKELEIELEYRYQSKEYASGRYNEQIKEGLENRTQIARVLLSFMSEKAKASKGIDEARYIENYYPVSVYSSFSGKDLTTVLNYNGEYEITYRCDETGEEETFDFRKKPIIKLAWKIDWPMRWREEEVSFEPGGKDHSSPGGSYDVSRVLSEKVFNRPAPVFVGYDFIGIQGLSGKMSGSKGGAVAPATLLEIYEPELLKWLYTRKLPKQIFDLAFNTEVYRQYDEFDREHARYERGKLTPALDESLRMAYSEGEPARCEEKQPIPFKHAVALGQIVQWDREKVESLAIGQGNNYTPESIDRRLPRAKVWLEKYNPDELIALLDKPNTEYFAGLDEAARGYVVQLAEYLESENPDSILELEKKAYSIPKDVNLSQEENSPRQRAFFKDVYNLLIGADTGPRLSTFLWAVDRKKVVSLLKPLSA